MTALKPFRDFLAGAIPTLDSQAALLEEPHRSQFLQLRDQYSAALATMPAADATPPSEVTWNVGGIIHGLMSAHGLIGKLTNSLTDMAQKHRALSTTNSQATLDQTVAALLPDKVKAEVDAKVKAGEFVAKEMVTSLCSEAALKGVAEGEQKVRGEIAAAARRGETITARKALLQTASLPLPEAEDILADTEEAFAAARKTAETRSARLQSLRVSHNSKFMAKVWASDEQFNLVETLLSEHIGSPRVEPLALPAGAMAAGGMGMI